MPFPIQLDDEAYASAKAFAEQTHCTIANAASRLVVKSGFSGGKKERTTVDPAIRFPLVHGAHPITAEDVARLEDASEPSKSS